MKSTSSHGMSFLDCFLLWRHELYCISTDTISFSRFLFHFFFGWWKPFLFIFFSPPTPFVSLDLLVFLDLLVLVFAYDAHMWERGKRESPSHFLCKIVSVEKQFVISNRRILSYDLVLTFLHFSSQTNRQTERNKLY